MITFRKAKMPDVESIHSLINELAEKGMMLPRSRNTLYEALREFTIVEDSGSFVGCGALHITWENLAEVRALALKPEYQGQGIGNLLIEKLAEEARDLGITQLFALTYQVNFFKRCGFEVVTKDAMPQKVWKECINCPKFPNCDETAMIKNLS